MASIFEAAPADLPLHLRPGAISTITNTASNTTEVQKELNMQAQLNVASRALPRMFARIPPPNFSSATHRARCLTQLRSKSNGLEKYIFLNGLKERDPNLFYSILYDNMRVSRLLHLDFTSNRKHCFSICVVACIPRWRLVLIKHLTPIGNRSHPLHAHRKQLLSPIPIRHFHYYHCQAGTMLCSC